MKNVSKVLAVTMPLLLVCCTVFAADLKTDVSNAVQHIEAGVKVQTGGMNVATLKKGKTVKVDLTGDGNFLILGLSSNNSIKQSVGSNVLGGKGNELGSVTVGSTLSTIIAGSGNKNISDGSTIGGGIENIIQAGSTNVIVGGLYNRISDGMNSTIIGGTSNRVSGNNSATVGKDNLVEGDNSVALGVGSKVSANGSFLWTDTGAELDINDVFAVISQHGMVVNTDTAHSLAQLTVGGSVVIAERPEDDMIDCSRGKGVGVMKLVNKNTNQKCLCSCNGQDWDSMLGDGQCKSVCNGMSEVNPECGNTVTVYTGEDGKKHYSGSCVSGTVINGSYYMSAKSINWACQEVNGKVEMCSYTLGCTGTIPGYTGVEPTSNRTARINNNITPDRQVDYYFSNNRGDICSFSCKDGYAWSGSECRQICDTSDSTTGRGKCFFGTLNLPSATWSQNYTYTCNYKVPGELMALDYNCEMICPSDQIWAGPTLGCQPKTSACSSTGCNLGVRTNDRGEDGLQFVWDCYDTVNKTFIAEGCTADKPIERRFVYFDKEFGASNVTVSFHITGAIQTGINITLSKRVGSDSFKINSGSLESSSSSYQQSEASYFSAKFTANNSETVDLPMPTFVYRLQLTGGDTTANLCSTSFTEAGLCLNGANSSNFKSGVSNGSVVFEWRCTSGSSVKNCKVSREIRAGNCSTIPTNGTGCNASNSSSCIPLKGATLNLRNFYLDGGLNGKVTSNGNGMKSHCVYSGGKIDCSSPTNDYQVWQGWKCKDGYNMNADDCTCTSNTTSACNGNIYTASCTNGSTTLGSATWNQSYSYTCSVTSETCNAKCATGKVWLGETLGCVAPSVCVNEDSTHGCYHSSVGPWTATSSEYVSDKNMWEWTCVRGEVSQTCHECDSGYTRNGNGCSAESLDCSATGIALNGVSYSVPALSNNSNTGVAGRSSIKSCTVTASCSNGVVDLSNESCTNYCGTGPSDTPKCNIGSAVNEDGETYGSSYSYYCKDGSHISVKCTINCTSGKYWNGSSCVATSPVCGDSAYNCIKGTSSGQYNSGNYYSWRCVLGSNWTGCEETKVSPAKDCVKQTVDGYSVPVLSHGATGSVQKYTSDGKCTAVAQCNDEDITISNESCVDACDGVGGCNIGSAVSFDGATFATGYNYKCDNGTKSRNCSAECGALKVWNGSECKAYNSLCTNNDYSECYGSNLYSTGLDGVRLSWTCRNGLGSKTCYECNDSNYELSGTTCVSKSCTLSDSNHTVIANGAKIEMYDNSEEYCPDTCKKKVVTECNNGVISGSANPWLYYEESCDTVNDCSYTLDECPDHGICNSCTSYSVNNNMCTTGSVKYYLRTCRTGYTKTGNQCLDRCEAGGGTWSVEEIEGGYAFGYTGNYYEDDWRVIETGIDSYSKTCGSSASCGYYGFECGGTFTPTQRYWRSYTLYAERWAEYHKCSNNSSYNYYEITDREDGNEQYVIENNDYTDATHQHGECGANAGSVCETDCPETPDWEDRDVWGYTFSYNNGSALADGLWGYVRSNGVAICDLTVEDNFGNTYMIYSGDMQSSTFVVPEGFNSQDCSWRPVSVSPEFCVLGDKYYHYKADC